MRSRSFLAGVVALAAVVAVSACDENAASDPTVTDGHETSASAAGGTTTTVFTVVFNDPTPGWIVRVAELQGTTDIDGEPGRLGRPGEQYTRVVLAVTARGRSDAAPSLALGFAIGLPEQRATGGSASCSPPSDPSVPVELCYPSLQVLSGYDPVPSGETVEVVVVTQNAYSTDCCGATMARFFAGPRDHLVEFPLPEPTDPNARTAALGFSDSVRAICNRAGDLIIEDRRTFTAAYVFPSEEIATLNDRRLAVFEVAVAELRDLAPTAPDPAQWNAAVDELDDIGTTFLAGAAAAARSTEPNAYASFTDDFHPTVWELASELSMLATEWDTDMMGCTDLTGLGLGS